jgi:uncharacterized membrane protein YfcA
MLLMLAAAALGTSALSALFGMAGGMLMMGVCTAVLPVASAMVLHGATQAVANGLRAALAWRHVRWPVVGAYAVGAVTACAVLWPVRWVPEPAVVFVGIGALAITAGRLPAQAWMDPERPVVAALAGAVVGGVQLLVGVGGPLLDLFFVQSRLGRREVVATKAVTQVLAHLVKIVFFGVAAFPDVHMVLATTTAAVVGTVLGGRLLERMSDTNWRAATRWVLAGVGGFYLVKGVVAW